LIQQYDDVKIGYDNNGDGDILDAGDDLQVSDNFSSNVMSLTYDNNGNLTDDGVLRYVYDAWNRLRKAQRYADGDTTTIATYGYLPDTRRASKVVEHCGIEAVANDGGDTTVHFYYSKKWQIVETRNGSNQSTRQWVWGTQYVDEVILMDVNGNPGNSNDCDPDYTPQGDGQDRRYFYHQDRNWNVVALTEYDDGAGTNGRVTERCAYTPYGEFVVTKGDGGSGELGRTLPASSVGNTFFHQGLAFDQEKGSYQNRHREYVAKLQRFARRDPLEYVDTTDLYIPGKADPALGLDPSGTVYFRCCRCPTCLAGDWAGYKPGPFVTTSVFPCPTMGQQCCQAACITACATPWWGNPELQGEGAYVICIIMYCW
jgi:RHS repeat-associated protein